MKIRPGTMQKPHQPCDFALLCLHHGFPRPAVCLRQVQAAGCKSIIYDMILEVSAAIHFHVMPRYVRSRLTLEIKGDIPLNAAARFACKVVQGNTVRRRRHHPSPLSSKFTMLSPHKRLLQLYVTSLIDDG